MPPRTLVSALASSDAANKDNHPVEKVRWFESQGWYCEVKRCMFGPALYQFENIYLDTSQVDSILPFVERL